jgi:hypothetical protein
MKPSISHVIALTRRGDAAYIYFMAGVKSIRKKRFAVGAEVRVIMPGVTGIVVQFDHEPTVLGEYWHTVKTESGERREPGSNLELIPEALTNPTPKVPNNVSAYDDALAHQILSALLETFPNKLSSTELKSRSAFVNVPQGQWLLVLDALLKLRLIDGTALRGSSLEDVANVEITSRGRETVAAIPVGGRQKDAQQRSNPTSKILVTLGGECFEIEYVGVGHSGGRDGVLYLFKLRDLLKDRGERNVSLFRSGTDRVLIEDYDARIEAVRSNSLRRAFDSGAFNFETPVEPDRYHELRLTAADFQPQKKADDETIRRFIKFGAYCLGFRHRPNNHPNLYVDFDCTEDLEFRCAPTSKLIDEIEQGVADSPQPTGGSLTQNIHFHGHNARLNVNSTDKSVNVASVSNDKTFIQMREVAQSIQDEAEREKILARIAELESTKGSSGFLSSYQSFISSVADYMSIFGPFIPALTQMLSWR